LGRIGGKESISATEKENPTKRILFFLMFISLIPAFVKADVSDKNAQLIQAATDGNLAATQALLAEDANVNVRDNFGATALMWATQNAYTEVIKFLLEKGADVNTKTNNGITALGAARMAGHTDIVQLLEKAGAKE
jgi:ankyrin repeat protein